MQHMFFVADMNVNMIYGVLNIVLFCFKSDSLYNDGMKPLIYSEKNAQQKKVGWVRGGSDIKYYKNNLRYETSPMPFFLLRATVNTVIFFLWYNVK